MRKHGRKDANQDAIVRALRQAGAHVQSLADVGGGCPDLLVSFRNRWMVMEVKDPNQPPSKRKLTDDERTWRACAMATVFVVETTAAALQVLEVVSF